MSEPDIARSVPQTTGCAARDDLVPPVPRLRHRHRRSRPLRSPARRRNRDTPAPATVRAEHRRRARPASVGPPTGRLRSLGPMERLQGRVALVTGAGSGIGQATAVRLAAEGAVVIALDVDEAGLTATKETCGPRALVDTVVGDVSERDLAPRVIGLAVERHGRLDVLANVAGILRTAHTHEHSFEVWDRVLAINLTGT